MNFEQHVETNYDSLSMNEKEMVQFIVQNQELIASKTIVEVGELLLTSKSTVLRLAKKIGFHGFVEMRYAIQDSIKKKNIKQSNIFNFATSKGYSKNISICGGIGFFPDFKTNL